MDERSILATYHVGKGAGAECGYYILTGFFGEELQKASLVPFSCLVPQCVM